MVGCKVTRKGSQTLNLCKANILFEMVDILSCQRPIEPRLQEIDHILGQKPIATKTVQGFHPLDQGMLGHGLTLSKIKGNLVLVKDGLELELISIHIPQEDSNIFVTNSLIQTLANGAGYRL